MLCSLQLLTKDVQKNFECGALMSAIYSTSPPIALLSRVTTDQSASAVSCGWAGSRHSGPIKLQSVFTPPPPLLMTFFCGGN